MADMGPLPRELARRTPSGIQANPAAARVAWTLGPLPVRDGHDVTLKFSCAVKVHDTDADKTVFAETFLNDRPIATADQVEAFAADAMAAAARAVVKDMEAATIVALSDGTRAALCKSLNDAAAKRAFDIGLEVLPPAELSATSASLERARLEAQQRAREQAAAERQAKSVQQVGELLASFESLRKNLPELSPGQLLERIAPSDRGATLQSLLAASAARFGARAVLAVARNRLVRVPLDSASAPIASIELTEQLGPMRSVRFDPQANRLLLGARGGVLAADPEHTSDARAYPAPADNASPLGFNSVAIDQQAGLIVGCHSEIGLCAWRIDPPGQPAVVIRPGSFTGVVSPAGPRHVTKLGGGRFACAVEGAVVMFDGQRAYPLGDATAGSPVVGLFADGDRLLVVRRGGAVEQIHLATGASVPLIQHPTSVALSAPLPWLGSLRVLLCEEGGEIDCVGPDDSVVMRFASRYRGFAALSSCASHIAALAADRSRLVIWPTHDGRQPAVDLNLLPHARGTVADVTVL
jgi:hypothetical protein